MARQVGDERGQITVMTVGFFLFLGLLAVVVINSSHAFLERRDLDNLADGAALTAADGLDEEGFYTTGEVESDPQTARRLVGQYVAGTGARIVAVRTTDEHVTVLLERRMNLAINAPGLPSSTTVTAEATSQLRVGG